ncbi:hypothetical protein COY23_03705 [bacterium (Candidatus Torokbacteria) CG_4_10_14_0_2_um_filter_35_8]|nr:MAG: hypothetical protein COY23_03705 [bacterium (Candidatus Torokbacteria) CG_4_10_14_0_2_um_filter_35_8]
MQVSYELTYILSPKTEEKEKEAIKGKILKEIKGVGKAFFESTWERQELSYPIYGFQNGDYETISFTFEKKKLDLLKELLKQEKSIIRHLLVKKDEKDLRREQVKQEEDKEETKERESRKDKKTGRREVTKVQEAKKLSSKKKENLDLDEILKEDYLSSKL